MKLKPIAVMTLGLVTIPCIASPQARITVGPNVQVSVRVSESPNTTTEKSGTGVTGGDTAGLAASPDGRFHALWIDNRTGIQQVWTAPITVQSR